MKPKLIMEKIQQMEDDIVKSKRERQRILYSLILVPLLILVFYFFIVNFRIIGEELGYNVANASFNLMVSYIVICIIAVGIMVIWVDL